MGEHLTIPLSGLSCASECQALERQLRGVPGVLDAYVNPANDTAYIEYDPALSSRSNVSDRAQEVVRERW